MSRAQQTGPMPDKAGLYTISQMRQADAGAIAAGVAGIELMENAGAAVADVIRDTYESAKTVILAGPGNNGGDGFVVARHLSQAGWPVQVAMLGDPSVLRGDAAMARDRWEGSVIDLEASALDGAGIVVDALFGAGLARPIGEPAASVLKTASAAKVPIVAVDIPSGIHGDTGQVHGVAAKAEVTVTFHRAKSGHFLLPGREYVGRLVIADIGIPDSVDQSLDIALFANKRSLWLGSFPKRETASHKYHHGHALVLGGGMASSGAARLAARAALRAGAGLVTALCPASALPVYAAALTAVMVRPIAGDDESFAQELADSRRNAILLGPGSGIGEALCRKVEGALASSKAVILDADALTSFEAEPKRLFESIRKNGRVLLTPHEGEFSRLFGVKGDKLHRARRAASSSGATVLLKGADTVVASPDGRASILTEAPPTLATAGSGDVLAGIALGLIAQSMLIFEAASAAAWLHAEAAKTFGPGLIAEDLADQLPEIFSRLQNEIV